MKHSQIRKRKDKKCSRCKETKLVAEFHTKSKGPTGTQYYQGWCKMCEKKRDGQRFEYHKKYNVDYKVTHPGYMAERQEASRKRNMDKNRTRLRTRYHINAGHIKKLPCVVCGEINVHSHHPDYNDHMRVVWLCPLHHSRLHAGDYELVNDIPVMVFDRDSA